MDLIYPLGLPAGLLISAGLKICCNALEVRLCFESKNLERRSAQMNADKISENLRSSASQKIWLRLAGVGELSFQTQNLCSYAEKFKARPGRILYPRCDTFAQA